MARYERRRSMPLDEAYFYCRRLELKLERPALFKVCNAIRTVDLALLPDSDTHPGVSAHISAEAWSRIRDQLFKILVTSFAGYFLVYEEGRTEPLEQGSHWPVKGYVEFYPEKILRRFETYCCELSRMDPVTLTILRWCFSQDRHNISPALFNTEPEIELEEDETLAFLDRMYEICEEEASEGKKKAHRKWCQLYWEASGCPDRRVRHELQKKDAVLAISLGPTSPGSVAITQDPNTGKCAAITRERRQPSGIFKELGLHEPAKCRRPRGLASQSFEIFSLA